MLSERHVANCRLNNTDQGLVFILTLLDPSAAFDTTDDVILLTDLSTTFGVSDFAHQRLHSYITDRFMTVTANGVTAASTRLDFGVLQGLVLGPLLFVLYTHPLSQSVVHSGFDRHKFSDHTQFLNSASSVDFNLVSKQTQSAVWRSEWPWS